MPSKIKTLPKGTRLRQVKEKYIILPLQIRLLKLDGDIQLTKDPNLKKSLLSAYEKLDKELKEAIDSPDTLPKNNEIQVDPEQESLDTEQEGNNGE